MNRARRRCVRKEVRPADAGLHIRSTHMKQHVLTAAIAAAAWLAAVPAIAQTAAPARPGTSALPPAAPPNAEVGPGPATQPGAGMGALPAAGTNTSLSVADKAFVEKAAQGGLAEVAAAKLAQQKTQSDGVKQFAQKMVDDHTQNNDQLEKLATAKGLTPPTDPSAMQQKQMSRLEGLDGAKFDRAYLRDQVKDHQAMLRLMEREASHGADPDLKSFAQQTATAVREHLTMAQQLEKTGS
jgi:putative membrane protein